MRYGFTETFDLMTGYFTPRLRAARTVPEASIKVSFLRGTETLSHRWHKKVWFGKWKGLERRGENEEIVSSFSIWALSESLKLIFSRANLSKNIYFVGAETPEFFICGEKIGVELKLIA